MAFVDTYSYEEYQNQNEVSLVPFNIMILSDTFKFYWPDQTKSVLNNTKWWHFGQNI